MFYEPHMHGGQRDLDRVRRIVCRDHHLSSILALEMEFRLFSDGYAGQVLRYADDEILAVVVVRRLDRHKPARGQRAGGRTTRARTASDR